MVSKLVSLSSSTYVPIVLRESISRARITTQGNFFILSDRTNIVDVRYCKSACVAEVWRHREREKHREIEREQKTKRHTAVHNGCIKGFQTNAL